MVPNSSTGRAKKSAKRSGLASARVLGRSSPNRMVARLMIAVTIKRARPPAEGASNGMVARTSLSPATWLSAAKADAQEGHERDADLDDGKELARSGQQLLDAARGGAAFVDKLLDPAAPDGHQRDLGRHEERLEEDQDRDDEDDSEHGQADATSSGSGASAARSSETGSDRAPSSAGRRCSRMRAGTPTASLPGGTSRVTTDPAPVTAPSPTLIGARRMVSEPMKAPSPIFVLCLRRPS